MKKRNIVKTSAGKPLTFRGAICATSSVIGYAALMSSVSAQSLVTGSTTLSGTLNGNNNAGYYVGSGGTLTVNSGTLQNFTTTGGAGSGGGAGFGGAIFVDNNGIVVLNGVSVLHNTAVGGVGGNGSLVGGTLNNGAANGYFSASSDGSTGAAGTQYPDNVVFFGDGKGDGDTGNSGNSGGNATTGFGGAGGVGGAGTNGWSTNPIASANVAIATAGLANATVNAGFDAATLISDTAAVAAYSAAEADPLEAPAATAGDVKSAADVVVDALKVANDAVAVATATTGLAIAAATLAAYNNALAAGTVGNGGSGGTGGSGGSGSYGFGGGSGGAGGAQGSGATSVNSAGTGGSGGSGGSGGFGGGGGSGGAGYFGASTSQVPTSTLLAPYNVEALGGYGTGSAGSGGAGGAGGFGAGVGSNGSGSGGGGGDGYGGAIFVNASGTLVITGTSTFAGNSAIGGSSLNGGLAGGAVGSDLFIMTGATVRLAPGAGNVVTFNGTIADDSAASIGTPSTPLVAGNPIGAGASLTTYAGLTVFNGQNTYSGQTIINGGALDGTPNTATNMTGAPDYAHTAGALQAVDGVGLPTTSILTFAGPSQYIGGVLQTNGTFTRFVSATPNPYGLGNPGGVQWTGSGGFAAINDPLTVKLNAGGALNWGLNGFVPFGSSLMFGSANSTDRVTFTNAMNISGGTASVVVVNNGTAASDALLSGVISGTGNLSVNGGGYNGVLNLSAANTYSGTTTVNSGTLALVGAGSIASSSSVTVYGTLDVSKATSTASLATLAGSGTIALGSNTLNLTTASTTFSGALVDGGLGGGTGGGLTVSAGTETLTGANTYTGATAVASGATLALSGAGTIAFSSGVADNGTFDISQTTLGASIKTLSGSGIASAGSKLLMVTNGSTTFSGVIADGGLGGGTGGMLDITGGTQTLTGTNTYTGLTAVASGATLALSGSGSIAPSIGVNTLGTLDISQTTTGAAITTLSNLPVAPATATGTVVLGAKTLTITNGSTLFSGVLADGGIGGGTGGKLTLSGGTETLSGTNTYTGLTTVAPTTGSATLALTGTGSIATSSGVAIATNGTFDISQTTAGATIATLQDSGVAPSGLVVLGAQRLTVANASTTFSGVIADGGIGGGTAGNLTIAGGTQTLAGANTYTGLTTITPSAPNGTATLALTGTGSIATSIGVVVSTGGKLDISQTAAGASVTTLSGAGGVSVGGETLTITAGGAGISSATPAGVFSGVIADGGIGGGTGGGVTLTGGIETFTGVNTYTGATQVSPGTAAVLVLSGAGSIATSSGVSLATGGMLDVSQTTSGASVKTLADIGVTPTSFVSIGSKTLTVTSGSTTFSGVIADGGIGGGTGGSFAVSGGTQTLAGVNAYTGTTTVAPAAVNGTATLALSGAGSIASSSGLTIATGGTFDIAQTTSGASITTLGGAGSVALGSQTLTITAGAAGAAGTLPAGVFSGTIGGAGALAITGGHQELTGVNTYLGGTTVVNATLSINSGASLGAATGSLTLNNATLVADANLSTTRPVTLLGSDTINTGGFNVSLSGNIGGAGGVTASGGGTLNLTGTNSYTGGTVVGPNTSLTTNSNAALGSGPVTIMSPTGVALNVFSGSAHIVGPLDLVNSANPELIVQPGDTLVGVGSVSVPIVIQSGGRSAPGDGPGSISVAASVVAMPGSTNSFDIDGPLTSVGCVNVNGCAGTYATIVVTGAGNTYTAGGTLAPNLRNIGAPANNDYTPPVTTSFQIVQAAGGVLGSYSSLTQPAAGLAPSTRFDALYTSNAITLYVTPTNYQNLSAFGVSLNPNQSQVGAGINALRGAAGLRNNALGTADLALIFQQQPGALPGVFNTLSGEALTGAKQESMKLTSQLLSAMLDPYVNGRFGNVTGQAVAYDLGGPVRDGRSLAYDPRWSTWGSLSGGGVTASGNTFAGTHDVKASGAAGAAGIDYHAAPNIVVGAAVGGGGTNWNLSQGLGGGRSDAFQVGAYGMTNYGPAYLGASAAFSNHWFTTKRSAFTGETLTGSFSGQNYGGRVEAGYRFAMPLVAITPYGAVDVQNFSTPSFSEADSNGGGFGLTYNAANATAVRTEIGARFDTLISNVGAMQVFLYGRAAFEHYSLNNAAVGATFNAALQAGAVPGAATAFNVSGAVLPANSALVSVGSIFRVTPTFSIDTKFEGSEFARGSQSLGGTVTARLVW